MRVAIFTETYFPFISGVVSHIQTLKEGLEQQGHTVLIVTLDPKADRHYVKNDILYCPAIPLKKVYGYGVANPVNLHRLEIVRGFNPDIIHMHTEFSMGIFASFAAERLHKPLVYTLHTMYDDYVFYIMPEKAPDRMKKMAKPLAHSYIRSVADKATEVIGPSYKVVEYLRRCGVQRHINLVPNTVDVTDFLPENTSEEKRKEFRKQLGLRDDDVAICFVGRLGKEKSIDVLIDYYAEQFQHNEKTRLLIAGDGPDRALLEAQICSGGLSECVQLLGRVEHERVPLLYAACDLFATASLTEMHSISLLEATASGLYALQRLDIYNRDQIASGKNGDVFNTAEEFGALVEEHLALSLPQRAERRRRVSEYARRYGPREFTQEILKVYERARHKHAGQTPKK